MVGSLDAQLRPATAMSKIGNAASQALVRPANALAALLDFAVTANRRAVVMLVLVSLAAFLPGFFQIPPIDRDEPRYAQATRQMLDSGDYVDIRFQQEAANDKPIGIYWLQAVAVKTAEALGLPQARQQIWVYRVPSLFGAIGAVLATYWCALAFAGRRGAVLAALMMAASILLGVELRLAKTDAVLLLTVVVAMGALARIYLAAREGRTERPSPAVAATFWTAFALGVLIKGLPIIMVVSLAVAALSILDRSVRWLLALRPIAGIAWSAVVVLPWFIAIYMRAGGAFLAASVGHDTLGKIINVQQGHGAPPGYYFLLFFITFFPGSILAALAVPGVVTSVRRRDPAVVFLLAWLLPSWAVFELAVTKLPHYVLPLYPAIAILIALMIEKNLLSLRPWLVRGAVWWFIAPILVSTIVIGGAFVIDRRLVVAAWPLLAAAVFSGALAWRFYRDKGADRALICATLAAMLMAAGVYGFVVPALKPLFPNVALAGILRASGCAHPLAASTGYEEPSLVFLMGADTQFVDPAGAADFLLQGNCRFAFVEEHQEPAFASRAQALGLHYETGPRVEGFNLGRVQHITMRVFRSDGTP